MNHPGAHMVHTEWKYYCNVCLWIPLTWIQI